MVPKLCGQWVFRTTTHIGAWARILAGLLLVVLAMVSSTPAAAAVGINSTLNYQGRLLTAAGAVVPDGAYNLEFKIYTGGTGCVSSGSSPCGGTSVWTEDWVYGSGAPDSRVIVRNGYFSVALGSLTSLSGVDFNNDTLWLSMNTGNTTTAASFAGAGGDGEMLPFKRLASSPYALNSGKLGGLTSGQFVQLAQGLQVDASTTNAAIAINKTGATASILDIQRGGAGVLLMNNAGQTLFRPQTDSQTALQVQKAGTTTTVFAVDTINSRVGINTPTPNYSLDVAGDINASGAYRVGTSTVISSSSAFSGTSAIFTAASALTLGTASSIDGAAVFRSSGGANIITLQAPSTNPVSSYVLKLPSVAPSLSQCLQNDGTTIGQLTFAACSAGSGANVTLSNLTGPTAINTDLTFVNGGNRALTVTTQTTAATAGDNLTVAPATGNTTGAGGVLALKGGTGGSAGAGGALTITGGNAGGGTTAGGDVTISGGAKSGASTSGKVIVKPQLGNDSTSAFQIQNAASTSLFNADTTNNIITASDTNVGTPVARRIISDGFESGNLSFWDSQIGPATLTTATKRNGRYAAQLTPSTTVASITSAVTLSNTIYSRGYFYSTSNGASAAGLMTFYLASSGASASEITVSRQATTGNLCVTVGALAPNCSATAFPLNQWNKIELNASSDTSFGSYILTLNGTILLNVTNVNTGSTLLDSFLLGDFNATTQTVYVDDIVVANTAPNDSASVNIADSLHVAGTTSVGPLFVQSYSNTATSLEVAAASGTDYFKILNSSRTASVLGNQVIIGCPTCGNFNAATTVLQLDGSNGSITTGLASLNGGLYYNSSNNRFEGVENGAVRTFANASLSNLIGPTAINTDLTFATGGARVLSVATQTTAATAGNNLTVNAATGNTSGAGGTLALKGGTGGTTGAGGTVTINGGNAGGGTAAGGNVTITGGAMSGVSTPGSIILKPAVGNDSATAIQMQNAGGVALLTADSSNAQIIFGKAGTGGLNGKIVLATTNASSFTSSLSVSASQGAQFDYTLPVALATTGDCLKAGTVSAPNVPLVFGSCGSGGGNLQAGYTSSTGGSTPEIKFDNTRAGLDLQDADTTLGGNLLTVRGSNSSGLGASLLSVASNGRVAIGSLGTSTGQLYVSGSQPATLAGSATAPAGTVAVAVVGKYSYVLSNTTLAIFDVSSPGAITALGTAVVGSSPSGFTVQGKYAYVANSGNSIIIIDVSNPMSPSVVTNLSVGVNIPSSVVVQGKYMYMLYLAGNVEIFDISKPNVPVSVGSVNPGGSNGKKIVVQGQYAYVTDSGSNTMYVISVANPSLPSVVGSVSTGGSTQPFGLAVQGRYVYVATTNLTFNFLVIDVSNPASPTTVGTATVPSGNTDIKVQGRYVYVTSAFNGIVTYDVSTPTAPVSLGTEAAVTGAYSLAVQGRYIYSLSSSQLQISDIGGAYIQQLEAGGIETGSAALLGTLSVNGEVVFDGGLTVSRSVVAYGGLSIGLADAIQTNLQLDSSSTFADSGTCSTTVNQGALYYNTNTNAIRSCVNAGWEDVVTTAGLGIMLYGVVPDSGANPGDLGSISSTNITNGPCKVSVGANLQTVSWTGCIAYSGGRKVTVTAGTAATTNAIAGQFQHLCLSNTTGQPVLSTAGTETANLSTKSLDTTNAITTSNPYVCLADIKYAAANNTISTIYDVRPFTTSQKVYATNMIIGGFLGELVKTNTSGPGAVSTTSTTTEQNIEGVVVATTGGISANTVNSIIAVSGPGSVKAITGTNVIGALLAPTTTGGYATTIAAPTSTFYGVLGSARSVWTGATACAINKDACEGSVLTNIKPR